MRPPTCLQICLCLVSLTSGSHTFAQSVLDFGAPDEDGAGYLAGSVLDLEAPAKVETGETSHPEKRRAKNTPKISASTALLGSAETEALILAVGLDYAGHRALRKVGLSAREWIAFFRANIAIESAFRSTARSHAGAIGLGQLMPETAQRLDVDPFDPKQNLQGSARYLLAQLERFGSKELALAAYNAGPETVAKYSGIPPYRETQAHVRKVMTLFRRSIGDTA